MLKIILSIGAKLGRSISQDFYKFYMNYDINILIVEDLLTTRLFLRRTLKKLGYTNVVLSPDGEEALEELGRKSFDLIISDWHMPKMDGLDFF